MSVSPARRQQASCQRLAWIADASLPGHRRHRWRTCIQPIAEQKGSEAKRSPAAASLSCRANRRPPRHTRSRRGRPYPPFGRRPPWGGAPRTCRRGFRDGGPRTSRLIAPENPGQVCVRRRSVPVCTADGGLRAFHSLLGLVPAGSSGQALARLGSDHHPSHDRVGQRFCAGTSIASAIRVAASRQGRRGAGAGRLV